MIKLRIAKLLEVELQNKCHKPESCRDLRDDHAGAWATNGHIDRLVLKNLVYRVHNVKNQVLKSNSLLLWRVTCVNHC